MNGARRIVLSGRVQGVGYRPFVYVTAQSLGLTGSVMNGSGRVYVHAEGSEDALKQLEIALVDAAPPLARPRLECSEAVDIRGSSAFEILASEAMEQAEIHLPPDLFTCDDCLAEMTDPAERRYGYPFINCTQCGPRYTIITGMPYDRPNTTMAGFPMCSDCEREYRDPTDRRFHAQPLACPVCGPQLLFDGSGEWAPLERAVAAIDEAAVVAVKGVGGYHLVCDAACDRAVQRLRDRKHRPDKPLAVMFPMSGDDGLDAVRQQLCLDDIDSEALLDPARPIVLVKKARSFSLSKHLAPGLNEIGAFLPYSPLHHELLRVLDRPLVATSGNLSGEPVLIDNDEASQRLGQIADVFLHHDRPIERPADDSVVRPMAGAPRMIRLGRGVAPMERTLPRPLAQPVLATGGHLKATVALGWDQRVVVSPHIGELDNSRSEKIFKNIINDIKNIYEVIPEVIACDLHPRYVSTRWAEDSGLRVMHIPHHHAHAAALAGEHPGVARWLTFTWDGVGYGEDGTLWGGEALVGSPGDWQRVASFRPFGLVGGDKVGREPWRSAAALMWEAGTEWQAAIEGSGLARQAWERHIARHESSAAGRLFDAAAALVLGREMASFEGQGPMELEQIAEDSSDFVAFGLEDDASGVLRADWEPLLAVLADASIPAARRAGIFHESMAQCLVCQVRALGRRYEFDAVGLSGGVFQNRHLTQRIVSLLAKQGIPLRLHRDIPANDGGLSFGQVIEAQALLEGGRPVI